MSHLPVLVDEVISRLVRDRRGAYFDLTVGAGGHLAAMANALSPEARLYGIDRDVSAVAAARQNLVGCKQKLRIEHASYGRFEAVVREFEDATFTGILLDLGLSSIQLDDPSRGFSFRYDGPLDMRFDSMGIGTTAGELVNSLDERHLAGLIRDYGEERQASRLAGEIVRERQKGMIRTTSHLAAIVRRTIPPPHQTKSLARLFQALRIAVNEELVLLEKLLPAAVQRLSPGGRLAAISYHSLEDRLVKQAFRKLSVGCICPPGLPQCLCGKAPLVRLITRRGIVPTDEEKARNPRSRSARLRVAERAVS
ncbi:MAG: 16S rRNA (cytosine(1402)-N(4))-methyltransferase RsmH [Candidatus Zixiibacteriota bacterium]